MLIVLDFLLKVELRDFVDREAVGKLEGDVIILRIGVLTNRNDAEVFMDAIDSLGDKLFLREDLAQLIIAPPVDQTLTVGKKS